MIAITPMVKLAGIAAALGIALAGSLYLNARQWADARAAREQCITAQRLAAADARAQLLAQQAGTTEAMITAATAQHQALVAEQQAALEAERRRASAYWRAVSGLKFGCAPGQAFVDAVNDAVQP